jgi:hypothetical protein
MLSFVYRYLIALISLAISVSINDNLSHEDTQ